MRLTCDASNAGNGAGAVWGTVWEMVQETVREKYICTCTCLRCELGCSMRRWACASYCARLTVCDLPCEGDWTREGKRQTLMVVGWQSTSDRRRRSRRSAVGSHAVGGHRTASGGWRSSIPCPEPAGPIKGYPRSGNVASAIGRKRVKSAS